MLVNAMMCIASSSNVCGCGREMFLRPGQLGKGYFLSNSTSAHISGADESSFYVYQGIQLAFALCMKLKPEDISSLKRNNRPSVIPHVNPFSRFFTVIALQNFAICIYLLATLRRTWSGMGERGNGFSTYAARCCSPRGVCVILCRTHFFSCFSESFSLLCGFSPPFYLRAVPHCNETGWEWWWDWRIVRSIPYFLDAHQNVSYFNCQPSLPVFLYNEFSTC